MDDTTKKRNHMIQYQIKARGIFDETVLNAMMNVPRHRFVPAEIQNLAYEDCALRVSHGQTISQPYIVALMTMMISPDNTMKVLEIGTGTGYQTAILGEICKVVVTIERIEALHLSAKQRLEEMGYDNINCILGDGYKGYAPEAPYDAILVAACPSEIPPVLIEQLAPGGRMAIPVGAGSQYLLLVTKELNGEITIEKKTEVRFVSMIHD